MANTLANDLLGGHSQFGLSHRKSIQDARIDCKFLKVTWRKFNGLASEIGGSENMFRQLFATNGAKNTFWLDSSSTEKVIHPQNLIILNRALGWVVYALLLHFHTGDSRVFFEHAGTSEIFVHGG